MNQFLVFVVLLGVPSNLSAQADKSKPAIVKIDARDKIPDDLTGFSMRRGEN